MDVTHIAWRHKYNDTRILEKECQSLSDEGMDVTYVTGGNVNKSIYGVDVRSIDQETGHGYSGYMNALQEIIDFCVKNESNVYHIHEPELIPVGLYLNTLGKCVIYDAHESTLYQKINSEKSLWKKVLETIGSVSFEKMASIAFDAIICATPTICETFPTKKTTVIRNFPKLEQIPDTYVPYPDRPNNIVYVGGISRSRGIKEIIESITLIPDKFDIRLQLAGEFQSTKLQKEITNMDGWKKVDYHGWISHKKVFEMLQNSKAGLVTLHNTRQYRNSLPIKMFEYMSVGLPIIASDFEEWKCILENPLCGLFVDPTNSQEIADSITWLFEHIERGEKLSENAKKSVKKQYNWESERERLIKTYDSMLVSQLDD